MSKFTEAEKMIEYGVVKGFKAIENGVVTGYKTIEHGVVTGYKAVENKFVDTFMTPDDSDADKASATCGQSQRHRVLFPKP